MDGRSCVLTLARCLDNAVCFASLRRLKMDCVWNDVAEGRTGSGKTTVITNNLARQMEAAGRDNILERKKLEFWR